MQRDTWKKISKENENNRPSDREDGVVLSETEKLRAELVRIRLEVEEFKAAFDFR